MAAGVWRYRLGPFWIISEIPVPELPESSDEAGQEVTIRLARVPEQIEGVVAHETRWWASVEEYLQRVPQVANYLVRAGREILIEPAPGTPAEDVRAYLLGPIFSNLCFQAGYYGLHASAVLGPHGVAAFIGDSGAGKSTLAGLLGRSGYAVVSDDLCLLDREQPGKGPPVVIPVAPALKLWSSALKHLGWSGEGLRRVWSQEEKFRVSVQEAAGGAPLAQIVFLEWAEEQSAEPALTALMPVDALARLMGSMHFEYILKATGKQEECFRLCARILQTLPALVLRRPRDFAQSDRVLQLVTKVLEPTAG